MLWVLPPKKRQKKKNWRLSWYCELEFLVFSLISALFLYVKEKERFKIHLKYGYIFKKVCCIETNFMVCMLCEWNNKIYNYLIWNLLVRYKLQKHFFFLQPHLWHMKVPRLGGRVRAAALGLHHSHSHTGSEPHLQPTQQLAAMADP